jgi:hypothetical protein
LDFCASLQSSAFSLGRGFGKGQGMEVDKVLGALTKVGRIARMICLERGIVKLLVRRRPSDVDDRQNSQGQIQCIGVKVTSTFRICYSVSCP